MPSRNNLGAGRFTNTPSPNVSVKWVLRTCEGYLSSRVRIMKTNIRLIGHQMFRPKTPHHKPFFRPFRELSEYLTTYGEAN